MYERRTVNSIEQAPNNGLVSFPSFEVTFTIESWNSIYYLTYRVVLD